jgi:hypothetical protein
LGLVEIAFARMGDLKHSSANFHEVPGNLQKRRLDGTTIQAFFAGRDVLQ